MELLTSLSANSTQPAFLLSKLAFGEISLKPFTGPPPPKRTSGKKRKQPSPDEPDKAQTDKPQGGQSTPANPDSKSSSSRLSKLHKAPSYAPAPAATNPVSSEDGGERLTQPPPSTGSSAPGSLDEAMEIPAQGAAKLLLDHCNAPLSSEITASFCFQQREHVEDEHKALSALMEMSEPDQVEPRVPSPSALPAQSLYFSLSFPLLSLSLSVSVSCNNNDKLLASPLKSVSNHLTGQLPQ
jgi:hypothetical protein